MSLLVLQDVSLHFGSKTIVEHLDLRIADGERVGLIGPNGSGKSTLLRIFAGEQEADGGSISRSKGSRIGYLPQDIALEGGRGLLEFVTSSVPGREALEEEIVGAEASLAEAQAAVEAGDDSRGEELMHVGVRLGVLHEQLAHHEQFFSEHEAMSILAGLGFKTSDHGRDLAEFSGGWKMRAVLAALLFQRPDLLLLDEPTNHLDMPSVAWFGDFLRRSSCAYVLISHDREFLNEQIERVLSFEVEGVRQYRGNLDGYAKQRAEEETILANKARNLAREREKAEQFITRFRAQANKAKAVQSRIKQLEKMEDVEQYQPRAIMRFTFPATERTANEVIHIEGLGKTYGEHRVLSHVNLSVMRGDRIGIIGVNGAGKTTLLKMISGELEPSEGEIRLGAHVRPSYYAQHHTDTLDQGATVFEEVARVDPSSGQTRVRSILGAFLFSGDDVDKQVSVLSGGERSRVALARMLVKPGNLLLMDEPTNHLDLDSSEALAEGLSRFDGTIVFVSHNRSFVRTLANKIWNVADGTVEVYPGTLDEYLERARNPEAAQAEAAAERASRPVGRPASQPASAAPSPSAPPSEASSERGRGRRSDKARKREEAERRRIRQQKVGPLEKRVAEYEARIAKLEEGQRARNLQLADPAVYEDEARRRTLLDEYQSAAAELEELNEAWEIATVELEEALEELEA